jgi:8-oxo-dGTP diphosphatase
MSTPTVPADRYIVNVEGVVARDGRYLLTVRGEGEAHAPGTLSPPGGKVEGITSAANVLEETVRREIREETGVEIGDDFTYLGNSAFVTDYGEVVVNIVFLCPYRSGVARPDEEEIAAVAWLTAAEVAAHPLAPPWTRQSIALAESHLARLPHRSPTRDEE